MRTVTLDILNEEAISLLKNLEVLKLIRFRKEKEVNNDQLSKALQYTVKLGLLKSAKKPLKLKNGTYGVRQVDVYFI